MGRAVTVSGRMYKVRLLCGAVMISTLALHSEASAQDDTTTDNSSDTTSVQSGPGAPTATVNAPLSDLALQSEVDRSLSDAAKVAQQSVADMMASEGGGASQSLQPVDVASLPPELKRPITVAWTGPAENLVQRVAQGIGYSYTEAGTPPVVPDMVVVRYNNEPAAIVLQDLGLRISKVAQIGIDTTARTITFVNNAPQVDPIEPPSTSSDALVVHHYRHRTVATPQPSIYGYPKNLFLSAN